MTVFFTCPKTNFNFSPTFMLSSANAFNLDQYKNLSFSKELMLMHDAFYMHISCYYMYNYELKKKKKTLVKQLTEPSNKSVPSPVGQAKQF